MNYSHTNNVNVLLPASLRPKQKELIKIENRKSKLDMYTYDPTLVVHASFHTVKVEAPLMLFGVLADGTAVGIFQ